MGFGRLETIPGPTTLPGGTVHLVHTLVCIWIDPSAGSPTETLLRLLLPLK